MRSIIQIFALGYCLVSYAADYSIDTISLQSDILIEQREYIRYLPSGTDISDSVVTIYLLDGEFSNYRYETMEYVKYRYPVIGIGIQNVDRRRDLLPVNDADKFLEFISMELIPLVEKDIRVEKRILYGHSFGGSFVLFAMLNNPGLFDKYIASSPTPIMDLIDSTLYFKLNIQLENNIKFFFSNGSKDMKQVKKWCERLHENLLEINLDRIQWKYEVYEGENHNTSDVISLINGLTY